MSQLPVYDSPESEFSAFGSDAPFFEATKARRIHLEEVFTRICTENAHAFFDAILGERPVFEDTGLGGLWMEEARLDLRVEDSEIEDEAKAQLSQRLTRLEEDGFLPPSHFVRRQWLGELSIRIRNERLRKEAMK